MRVMSQGMVRPALVVAMVALATTDARAASDLPRHMGMYASQGNALAMVDSKIDVRVRGPIAEATVTQTFKNDTDRVTEATYIFPLPLDAAVTAMEIETGARTIHAAIESREQAQQRYEKAVMAGVGAGLLDQERPDVFTQTVSAIPARGTVTVTLRIDTTARYQRGTWELVFPMVIAPRYVPGTASGRPTTGNGRSPDTDRAPDASRVTPGGAPGAGGKTEVALELGEVEAVTSPTHELAFAKGRYKLTDPKSDHDAVIRWKAKLPAAGWVEAGDDGGFAAIVVEARAAPAKRGPVRLQLLVDHAATTRGDADATKRPLLRALFGALDSRDQVDNRAPEQAQRALEEARPSGPFDLSAQLAHARADAALVLVSDGLVADDRAVIAAAAKLRVPVHVIGIGPAPNRSLLAAIAAASGGTVRFVTVGDDLAAIARDVVADVAALPDPLTITWGTLQPIEVVPATLPRLGAGQATLVVAKVRRVQKANARVQGDVIGFTAVTTPKPPDGAPSPRGAIARRWAKLRLDELIAAGNTRAITEHALRYGLVSPFTSMVAVGDEVIAQGGVKHSVPVAVSVPEGMHWQLVKHEITTEKLEQPSPEPKPDVTRAKDKAEKKPTIDKKTAPRKEHDGRSTIAGTSTPQDNGRSPIAGTSRPQHVPVPQPAPEPAPSKAAPTQPQPVAPTRPAAPAGEEREGADDSTGMRRNTPGRGGVDNDAAPRTAAKADEEAEPVEAVDLDVAYGGVAASRRLVRLALSLGGGITVVNRVADPLLAINGRVELGRGRTLFGLEGSLWLVDGVHPEGSALAALTRHLGQLLELGVGGGARIAREGAGPALDLSLRVRLIPHLSGYLRYDGALLFHDQTFDGQNTGSLGIEATW